MTFSWPQLLAVLLGISVTVISTAIFVQWRLRKGLRQLAVDALRENRTAMLELTQEDLAQIRLQAGEDLSRKQQEIARLVEPLQATLDQYQRHLTTLETRRQQDYGSLQQYLHNVAANHVELRRQTNNLVKALHASHVRGRWGELSLRRVVEMAGMVEYTDFSEQPLVESSEGRKRPDLIVHLPAGRSVVLDAKVPLDSYLRAVESENEEERKRFLRRHCRDLERHIDQLSSKEYWRSVAGSVDFVVLYIPLESLLSEALRLTPDLLERATARNVTLATPTTLIALLKTIEQGWRQERLAENARQISEAAHQLYQQLEAFSGRLAQVGVKLDGAVSAYNSAARQLREDVLSGAGELQRMGVAETEVSEPATVRRRAQ